jgi:hypothetical protein
MVGKADGTIDSAKLLNGLEAALKSTEPDAVAKWAEAFLEPALKTAMPTMTDAIGAADKAAKLAAIYAEGGSSPDMEFDESDLEGTEGMGAKPSGVVAAPATAIQLNRVLRDETRKTKAEEEALYDSLERDMSELFEKAQAHGKAWDDSMEKKRKAFRQFAGGIKDDLFGNLSQAMAGIDVSWGNMVKGMKASMFSDILKGGMSTGGTGTYGGLSNLFGYSAASWIGPIGAAYSLFKSIGSDKVRTNQTDAVAQAQSTVDAARAQLADLIAQSNMGTSGLDQDTVSQLLALQLSDPTLQEWRSDRGGLAGLAGGENVDYYFANESLIKSQLEGFAKVMEKVEGTQRFKEAAGQNAFTGSGTHVINNLTFNAGVLVADERAKDTLARDMWDRMQKLGMRS